MKTATLLIFSTEFSDMLNPELLSQLSKLKEQTEESKLRLSQTIITEESGGGLVRISLNGNREMVGLELNANPAEIEKDDLEDLLMVAFKRAMDKVNMLNEQEVMNSAKNLFPGL